MTQKKTVDANCYHGSCNTVFHSRPSRAAQDGEAGEGGEWNSTTRGGKCICFLFIQFHCIVVKKKGSAGVTAALINRFPAWMTDEMPDVTGVPSEEYSDLGTQPFEKGFQLISSISSPNFSCLGRKLFNNDNSNVISIHEMLTYSLWTSYSLSTLLETAGN